MKFKSCMLLLLLTLFAVFAPGCTPEQIIGETPEQDELMKLAFDAAENADYEGFAALIADGSDTGEDFTASIDALSDYIRGTVVSYKKTGYRINSGLNNGVTYRYDTYTYEVKTAYDTYVVTAVFVPGEGEWKLGSFNVVNKTEFESNGALLDFKRFDPVQAAMLLLNLITLGVIVWAVVLCAKSNVRLKALWIILSLLLFAGLSVIMVPGALRFNILLLNFDLTGLRKFLDGSRVYTVMLPVGAILFLALRKKLTASATLEKRLQEGVGGPPAGETPASVPEPKDAEGDLDAPAGHDDTDGGDGGRNI